MGVNRKHVEKIMGNNVHICLAFDDMTASSRVWYQCMSFSSNPKRWQDSPYVPHNTLSQMFADVGMILGHEQWLTVNASKNTRLGWDGLC
jgi:hypothetical protein